MPADHGGPGASMRRSQALRVAARVFEVILFDRTDRKEKHLSRKVLQTVIAPVPGPLAVLQPRAAGET